MKVAVVGAGPAGALIACGLAERGCDVTLFERRSDPLRVPDAQRTIQLSLSPRGLKALEAVGLREAVMARGIPLAARAFHPRDGASRLLPYPDPTWRNASIDRHTLAATVLDRALAQPRLTTRFGVTVADVEVRSAGVITQASDGTLSHEQFDLVIGADGVASQVRAALVRSPEVDFAKRVSPWGYAELSFTLPEGDAYRVPAIHVFPRETFFIACFPGRDGKLHGTLVAQHSAWQAARDAGSLAALLRRELPDLIPCLTRPIEQVAVRSLLPITIVRCGSWTDGERLLLAGDAAHATAPFMGQGVNIGLEDGAALLRVWDEQSGDRQRVCEAYQRERVAEGLACCDLSERAADLLLRMPPENPPPTPHPLTRLNFMGHRYADVARDIIPGWQPEIYAQAAAPALGDGLQFPAALLEPFDASPGALLFRQGDNADELLVLQSGSVQVASPTLGALSLRGPTVIGEMGWLGSPHRTASVTCETPARSHGSPTPNSTPSAAHSRRSRCHCCASSQHWRWNGSTGASTARLATSSCRLVPRRSSSNGSRPTSANSSRAPRSSAESGRRRSWNAAACDSPACCLKNTLSRRSCWPSTRANSLAPSSSARSQPAGS